MKQRRNGGIALFLFLVVHVAAFAQQYPSKPIRLVVPFGPGSGGDGAARIVAQKLGQLLQQQVIVENRTGAAGNIGADLVAKAAPDGYTLLVSSNGPHAANAALFRNMPFDPVKDFVPVALIGTVPMVLATVPASKVDSVAAVVQADRRAPGTANVALPSTTARLVLEMVNQKFDAKINPILYKDSGQAFTNLYGGHVEYAIDTLMAVLPQIRGGKLKPLAVSSLKRTEALPNVPTLAEAGLPGLSLVAWNMLFVPRGTPAPIVERLGNEVGKALADPETRQQLKTLGYEPSDRLPEAELAGFVESEVRKWGGLIRQANIKPE